MDNEYDVSWVTADKFEGTVGEVLDWHNSVEDALRNAKVGDVIALEHFDTVKETCFYTNVLEVLYKNEIL